VVLLHKTSRMVGYHLMTDDGEVGHVDDFLLDEATWVVRYLVVDTSNWIGGRSVLVSASVVTSIDSSSRRIRVRLTREQIKDSPSIDVADIDLEETLPSVWIL
jgi:sporulation protein YlmC with PRC-barrel domain